MQQNYKMLGIALRLHYIGKLQLEQAFKWISRISNMDVIMLMDGKPSCAWLHWGCICNGKTTTKTGRQVNITHSIRDVIMIMGRNLSVRKTSRLNFATILLPQTTQTLVRRRWKMVKMQITSRLPLRRWNNVETIESTLIQSRNNVGSSTLIQRL